MKITGEQLQGIYIDYNQQIWPLQILAYLIGLLVVVLILLRHIWAIRVVFTTLSFFWIWVGLMFWLPFASEGLLVGYIMVGIFLLQSIFFLQYVGGQTICLARVKEANLVLGLMMISYAMVGYPAFGILIRQNLLSSLPFGLTFSPLIIFTLGIVLLAGSKVHLIFLGLPFCCGLLGIFMITKGYWEDLGLVLSCLVGIPMILLNNKQIKYKKIKNTLKEGTTSWSLDISKESNNE